MKNCKHVWQFLRDELKRESPNVEWIDQQSGVFKIKNQIKIAKLWGEYKERKSTKPMDYEKMSRGIRLAKLKKNKINKSKNFFNRHSRKDGFFKFIDKSQPHGVKMVYQFGDKAVKNCNWLNSFVING